MSRPVEVPLSPGPRKSGSPQVHTVARDNWCQEWLCKCDLDSPAGKSIRKGIEHSTCTHDDSRLPSTRRWLRRGWCNALTMRECHVLSTPAKVAVASVVVVTLCTIVSREFWPLQKCLHRSVHHEEQLPGGTDPVTNPNLHVSPRPH